ncbi:hypothetical protein [Flavobacterium sp.]|uniref:hypothetical protein n=1 Tax=Flavobacterium sp. TaxID=239 RepID=UPI003529C5A2
MSGFKATIAVPQKNEKLGKINNFTMKHTNSSGELIIEIPAIISKGMVYYACLCVKR